jgi:hydroxypyruvate reductase
MLALGLDIPPAVATILADPANETPKPGDAAFASAEYRIIATPAGSLAAAGELAARAGYDIVNLGGDVTGEAREVAQVHATLALEAMAAGRRVAILSGGELSVTVHNAKGRGGRSQEYALAPRSRWRRPGCRTRGRYGRDRRRGGVPSDPAGAIVDAGTLGRARHADAQKLLDSNDATAFFEAAGGLIVRGPTHTNVNDFRVILVDP